MKNYKLVTNVYLQYLIYLNSINVWLNKVIPILFKFSRSVDGEDLDKVTVDNRP